MLRVEFHEKDSCVTMKIEGRFVGRFAEDARDLISRRKVPDGLVIDLSDVTFVDDTGEDVLSWFARIGARFLSDNAYSSDVCQRLTLPLLSASRRSPSKPNGNHRNPPPTE